MRAIIAIFNSMPESFLLPVHYKNKDLQFESELRVYGYSYKIAVNVNGTEIIFEPDEERNYRAVLSDLEIDKQKIDIELIRLIAAEIEANFK